MNFNKFFTQIATLKTTELGGQTSQFKLAPELRIIFSDKEINKQIPKKAAVLVLFYPDKNKNTRFLLTKRANYKGTHANQISFVGGKQEKEESLKQAALREAFEEVGILPTEVTVIRKMSEVYIPPSNFLVTPFFSFLNLRPSFKPNFEVAATIEILVSDLLDDAKITFTEMKTSYMGKVSVPCFKFNNNIVWGATAMILSEVKDLLKIISYK